MNTTVISADEADAFLVAFSSWLELSDKAKERYIARSCVYAQTHWECSEVVWEDDPDTDDVEVVDIPDDVKEAIAYYAYADSQGNLFGDPATRTEPVGNLRSESKKLGPLNTEKVYFRGGSLYPTGAESTLGYPDALMSAHGTYNYGSSSEITRT